MGLLDSIKNDVKKSGQSKGKFIFFKEGEKRRIRFLQDMEEGMKIDFHDSFSQGVMVPCQEVFGRECPYCDDSTLRTRSQYLWLIWDYDADEVKIFMFPVNNCSPIPALVAMMETYGTLTDRDYMISVSGKQQNKTYQVVPMDKEKFRNTKAKLLSEKTILSLVDKAYPNEDGGTPSKEKKGKTNVLVDAADDDFNENEFDKVTADVEQVPEPEPTEYDGLSAKQLYNMCKSRSIEAAIKKPERYYINLLIEDDKAHADWDDSEGDSESDENWDEE